MVGLRSLGPQIAQEDGGIMVRISKDAVRHGFSRREFIGLTATTAVATIAATAFDGAFAADDGPFVIANWGGITSRAMLNAWGAPFTAATGRPVEAAIFDYGKFSTQIKEGKVEWNWADVEGWYPLANADLLQDIPADLGLTADDFVDPSLFSKKAVGSYLNSYVIAYRTDKDRPHPATWAEFFDTAKFPGKRSLYNWPYGMIEIALLADGVPMDQLYPLDLDRAFEKIKSIKGDIVFWNTGAEAQQFIVSDAVDFIVPWSSRVSYLALGGLPVGIEWNQNLRIADFHVIPNGTDAAASLAFIKAALDPDAQAEFARQSGGLAPVTKAGAEKVSDDLKPYLATTPENWRKGIGSINDEWWAANLSDVTKRWYEFVGAQ